MQTESRLIDCACSDDKDKSILAHVSVTHPWLASATNLKDAQHVSLANPRVRRISLTLKGQKEALPGVFVQSSSIIL